MVFVGEAAKKFEKVRVRKGFFGQSVAIEKTTFKPRNPEFATVKDGDVMFTDFSVINDGSKTLVMVKDIKILDTLAGAAPGSVKYKQLTRVKMPGLAMVVISDLNYATGIGVAGALTAAGAATVSQRFSQWLFAPND
jgi:hypothetical protein